MNLFIKIIIILKILYFNTILRYNNRLYKIDDIAWEKTPLSTFETLNGPVTFVDYYKQVLFFL